MGLIAYLSISTCPKRKSTDANTEMTDIGVSDKAFNAIIMQMLQQATTNTLETNGKTENLSRDTEDMKKNQEKLELQTKILLDGLNIAD